MEQLDYNLLFRWFVGLAMDAPVWDASTFSKNRDRFADRQAHDPPQRQTMHPGRERFGWCSTLATTACNLVRPPKLLTEAPA
jgi:hypothetical protein